MYFCWGCVSLFLAMSDAVLRVSSRGAVAVEMKVHFVLFVFEAASFRVVFLLLGVAVVAQNVCSVAAVQLINVQRYELVLFFLKKQQNLWHAISDVIVFARFPPVKLEK